MTIILQWDSGSVIDEVLDLADEIMGSEGRRGVAEIRRSFQRSGVSRPGRPPAIQSGRLYRDIGFEYMRRPSPTLKIGAHATNPYAMAQELGSPSQNLRPRPYIWPQMKRSVKRINNRFKKAFR